MKKMLLTVLCSLMVFVTQSKAQTLLNEDFEGTAFPPEGWTKIDDPNPLICGQYAHWSLYTDPDGQITLQGRKNAYIDTKIYSTESEPGVDPARTEWLITPELTLPTEQSFKLEFRWTGNSISALERREYDVYVVISEDGGSTWSDPIWSLTNEEQMSNSGVVFPWANHARNTSVLDLSDFKGKNIKIGWKYQNFEDGKGDYFKLDAILVQDFIPVRQPVVDGTTSYTFDNSYIGITKRSAAPLIIRNSGINTLTVNSLSGLEGTDFSVDLDPTAVSLRSNEEYTYYAYYTPTETGLRTATLTISTNGGDMDVVLSGSKIVLDEGYTLESFEKDLFPPLGWTSSGWSRSSSIASGGSHAAGVNTYGGTCILRSPRLDLSDNGSHRIEFVYGNIFDGGDFGATSPDSEGFVEFSNDGGSTWSSLGALDDLSGEWIHFDATLEGNGSDNCYIRFKYTCPTPTGDEDEDIINADLYIDDIVLPPLYGATSAPGQATNPSPANSAVDQNTDGLLLKWNGVLHAENYKLKVSTTAENTGDFLNTTLTETSYLLNGLEATKTYYWSVTPSNSYGDCPNVPIWQFTTMADQTIRTFPYTNGFESSTFPTLGWRIETSGESQGWDITDIDPYEGNYSAISGAHIGENILLMPKVALPADDEMQISFYWGNNVPAGLVINEKPAAPSTTPNGADEIRFEISTDGTNWTELAYLSESINSDDRPWRRVKITLEQYKGQNVYMRWRYNSTNYMKAKGASLDAVVIEGFEATGKAVFNREGWEAGVINKGKTMTSKDLTVMNDGKDALTISSATFTSQNFSTSLQPTVVIDPTQTIDFTVSFTAIVPGDIKDTLVVTFQNGLVAKLPVTGTALDENTKCYTFEDCTPWTQEAQPFTLIDKDGLGTTKFDGIMFPNMMTPMSFMVLGPPDGVNSDWNIGTYFKAVSGMQYLGAFSATDDISDVEDWLISEQMTATENSRLRFYARSYVSNEQFNLHRITVLVSESDINAGAKGQTGSFKVLPGADRLEVPYDGPVERFTEFSFDLSSYAGKTIYVALRHNVIDGLVMFLDDVWLENFKFMSEGNHAPQFTTTPIERAEVDVPYLYQYAVIDADGDPLTINVKGLPGWLTHTPGTNGGAISGTPTETGECIYKIIASDGKDEVTQQIEMTIVPTGIDEYDITSIMVGPNPADHTLNIQAPFEYEVTLTSIAGVPVYQGTNETTVDISGLPSGIYILQLKGDNRTFTTRIVKK